MRAKARLLSASLRDGVKLPDVLRISGLLEARSASKATLYAAEHMSGGVEGRGALVKRSFTEKRSSACRREVSLSPT
jgi:hypothetical protein